MIIDNTLDVRITEKLRAKRELDRGGHVSSGKLSASILGWPTQWQILKSLKAGVKEIDEYTLRKFLRGDHVEKFVVDHTDHISKQQFIQYRNVVGYVDLVVDTDKWNCKKGIIPLEVKSVTNMKYKRIEKTNECDPQHKLQAGIYALALKKEYYGICYVASDDYRIRVSIYETKDIKEEVDKIIDEYDKALESKTIPLFEARYKWQENMDYCNYPEYMNLSEIELALKYKELNNS